MIQTIRSVWGRYEYYREIDHFMEYRPEGEFAFVSVCSKLKGKTAPMGPTANSRHCSNCERVLEARERETDD